MSASDDPAHRRTSLENLETRDAAADLETDYVTPKSHQAAFAPPNHVKRPIS